MLVFTQGQHVINGLMNNAANSYDLVPPSNKNNTFCNYVILRLTHSTMVGPPPVIYIDKC